MTTRILKTLKHSFYDKVLNETLVLTDFIDDENIINDYGLTLNRITFIPIARIRFYLEERGAGLAQKMKDDIENADYPFF